MHFIFLNLIIPIGSALYVKAEIIAENNMSYVNNIHLVLIASFRLITFFGFPLTMWYVNDLDVELGLNDVHLFVT